MSDARKETQIFEALLKIRWETEVFPDDPDDVYELAELEKPYLDNMLEVVSDDVENSVDGTVEVVKFGPVID